MIRALTALLLVFPLASCLAGAALNATGRVIGTTVGVTANVVEAGVKVTGAVVDAVVCAKTGPVPTNIASTPKPRTPVRSFPAPLFTRNPLPMISGEIMAYKTDFVNSDP